MGDHTADCCDFLLFCSISLLGELNKTGQFCFLFSSSSFLVFSHTSRRDFGFSFPFTAGFNLPHPQNNISYTLALTHTHTHTHTHNASNWLCLLKLLETLTVHVYKNLNLGPALFGGVSLPQRNLLAFFHFKALGSIQMLLERELFFPP